jgi:NAD(P)-dependent dehydrogenase (short-subunit alcohol dehydrogenase family)
LISGVGSGMGRAMALLFGQEGARVALVARKPAVIEALAEEIRAGNGELGKGYIEAHHKIPLSKLPRDGFVRLSAQDEFAVVCSNCHSMIHRPGAPDSFGTFLKQYRADRIPRKEES